ncbi:transposase-like protein [Bradyrhizobium sp. JR6.1]
MTVPVCPRCSVRMALAHCRPSRAGFELQTFECPVCERAKTVEVPDPTERAAGWLASRELQRASIGARHTQRAGALRRSLEQSPQPEPVVPSRSW